MRRPTKCDKAVGREARNWVLGGRASGDKQATSESEVLALGRDECDLTPSGVFSVFSYEPRSGVGFDRG